ncbi:MAG TPA: deoxyribose-phosphate aldolase [Nitrospirae bacterium]|nr:deoxyribose-phosphate aldolase [Nitrospirota bacterium]HDY72042.1 deoxyribose-phosphate aldolase [Nitrospirota bacterium]
MRKEELRAIAGRIDHTNLRPDVVLSGIERLCAEAVEYGFYSVCVAPAYIRKAAVFLSGSDVKVTTVVGFPLGFTLASVKVYESLEAMMCGADEIDVVMNISRAKEGDWGYVEKELNSIVLATGDLVRKLIIETGYLNDAEIATASEAAVAGGADFVKTSTGFGPRGASLGDIGLIKDTVGGRVSIKAAGGIRDLGTVREFIDAGADRIGTSSGAEIMREAAGGTGPHS